MKIRKSVRRSQQLMVFSIFALIISLFFSGRYIQAFTEIENDLKALLASVDNVLRLEHKLLLDRDLSTISESSANFVNLYRDITTLQEHIDAFNIKESNVTELEVHVRTMEVYFNELVALQVEVGLTEDEGVKVRFRNVAHNLQNIIDGVHQDKLQISLLEIRRREKDFLLRGNEQFLALQKTHIVNLREGIKSATIEESMRVNLQAMLVEYEQTFYTLVEKVKRQGITNNQGVRHLLSIEEREIEKHTGALTKVISATVQERIALVLMLVAIFISIMLMASAIWLMYVNRNIYKGLVSISSTMKIITNSSDFSLRFEGLEDDEFAKLSEELNSLLSHFELVLKRLSDAKDRMIESEKMASLVGMVSGVAHELNTPLGVAMTCESVLKEKIIDLRRDFDNGELKKSSLERLICEAEQSISLMEVNLYKTEALITQFKEITSYQNYDETVEFNLHSIAKGVLITLNHELKKIQCHVQLQVNDALKFVGYAGAMSQLMQILLLNCIRHAYKDGEILNVMIAADYIDKALVLTIKDDGVGITKSNLEKVFEPFYTTKRNKGGTGLGLSVVYNLVTQKLNGTIFVDSDGEGKGVLVTMHLPDIEPLVN